MKHTVKLNESQLKKIVAESVKKILREWNEDEDNYFGGGLPDKNFDNAEKPEVENVECDMYVVMNSMTDDIIGIYRSKQNAIEACEKPYYYFCGYNFKD